MKAWKVSNEDGYSTVIFAVTRGVAKTIAMRTDICEYMAFTDIRVYRFPDADKMYRGCYEMDWDNDDDRRFLIQHGWRCMDTPDIIDLCQACTDNDVCEWYQDYKNEDFGGIFLGVI